MIHGPYISQHPYDLFPVRWLRMTPTLCWLDSWTWFDSNATSRASTWPQAENDTNAALDALMDAAQAEALQVAAVQTAEDAAANGAAATQLAAMGFKRQYAEKALQKGAAGDVAAALAMLNGWGAVAWEAQLNAADGTTALPIRIRIGAMFCRGGTHRISCGVL